MIKTLCVLLVLILGCSLQLDAKFIARTLPTAVSSHATHFDGLFDPSADCTNQDQLQLIFNASTQELHTHITPTKFSITFFLDASSDEIVGTASGSFNKLSSDLVKISFSKPVPKSTLLRFAGTVTYSFINIDAYNRVSNPYISFEYHQNPSALASSPSSLSSQISVQQSTKITAIANLFYTKVLNDATTYSANLVHDDGKTDTYHVFADIHHLPFETNHLILRTFGSLRSSPSFNPAAIECTINSLKFNVKLAQDALGDTFYELTLDKTPYLASYHFPSRIDLALECMFGQKLPNSKAPFGISLQFVPKSDESLPSNDHAPAAVIVDKDISVITWHADFQASYKFIFNYDSYQFSYLPYDLTDDHSKDKLTMLMTEQDIIAQLNKQPLHRIHDNSLVNVSTVKDDVKKVYRSHYSYLFEIKGASLEWNSDDMWFDAKLQNTHRAKHISTNWSHFVTKTLSTDKTINDVTMLATGTLEPVDRSDEDTKDDNVNNQIHLRPFSFNVSKKQAEKYKSPISFLSMQVVVEHEKLPEVAELHPASLVIALNHKVKKYEDQPLSLFRHLSAVSYPYSKPFVNKVNDLVVTPKEAPTGEKQHNIRRYHFDITLTNPTENSDIIHFYLGSQEYFFDGDFTTCRFNDKVIPGVTSYGAAFKGVNGYFVSFSLADKSDIVVKGQKMVVSCPDGVLLSSNDPDTEADFYHDFIYFAFIGYDLEGEQTSLGAHYASARIAFTDYLYAPATKGLGIAAVLLALCILITIASLLYLLWVKRDSFACMKRWHSPVRHNSNQGTINGGDYLNDLGSQQYAPPTFN